MPRYEFQKEAGAGLLDQLIAAGFPPETLVEMDGDRCWITCTPEQFDAAASVVAAHDAVAIEAQRKAEERADAQDRDLVREGALILLADADRLESTTTTLTAQQIRNHLARTNRAIVALARILRRRGLV